jgi:hypothetical protein
LAVAPVGSVLPAAAAGADLVAVADLAAVAAGAAAAGAAAAGAAAVAGAAAGVLEAAVFAGLDAFCTPPWPLHVPLPVDVLVVPSAQVVAAPVLAGAAGAAGVAGAAGAAAGAAGAAAGAAVVFAAFWMPPWPLQVPFPVEVVVVPSLQVVGAESAACAGSDNANISKGAAIRPAREDFFMIVHSPI